MIGNPKMHERGLARRRADGIARAANLEDAVGKATIREGQGFRRRNSADVPYYAYPVRLSSTRDLSSGWACSGVERLT